jgi:hypothetical protein
LTIRTASPATQQGIQGGEADRAGAEDDLLRSSAHAVSFEVAAAGMAPTVGLESAPGMTDALGRGAPATIATS